MLTKSAKWIKNNPRLAGISLFVFILHLMLILLPSIHLPHVKQIDKPLTIRTYAPPPPVAPPRATITKTPTPSQPKRKPKPSPSTTKRKKVLKDIEDTLTKMIPKSPTLHVDSPLSIPDEINLLQINKTTQKTSPSNPLISYLRSQLRLPEYGAVTVDMIISSGKLKKMKIVSSENETNALYLKHHLPLLSFPIMKDNEKTWRVTFCNER